MTRSIRLATAFAWVIAAGGTAAASPDDIPDEAHDAVAVVDRFFDSLAAGDIDQAASLLDPELIVLENGGAERSAAEYLASHAKSDAEFLKTAEMKRGPRTARVSDNLAWVASESDLLVERDGVPMTIANAETMVLKATAEGWRIVHIHWSSHVNEPGP
jgi:ketosteroid isomerase-like protein